jgi:hypothetical protein
MINSLNRNEIKEDILEALDSNVPFKDVLKGYKSFWLCDVIEKKRKSCKLYKKSEHKLSNNYTSFNWDGNVLSIETNDLNLDISLLKNREGEGSLI